MRSRDWVATSILIVTLWWTVADAAIEFAQGSYVGDGTDNRAIIDGGFQPDVVIVKGDINEFAYIRTSTMTGDVSKTLADNKDIAPNFIQSLTVSGFVVGNDDAVNASGVDYYWTAFKASAGELAVGTYNGNGVDNRSITTVGFQPDYVIVFQEGNEEPMQRYADQPFDMSADFKGSGDKADRIQVFEPTGFQLGKHNTVNQASEKYHYIAWKSQAFRVSTNTYDGDKIDGRSIGGVGFEPEFVIITQEKDKAAVFRTTSIVGDNSFLFKNSALLDNLIQALQADGFEIGNADEVNKDNETYYWVAFSEGPIADLQLTMNVDDWYPDESDTIAFTLAVDNAGPDDATSIGLSDELPVGLTYVGHATTQGDYDTATALWSVGDLAVGSTATLTLRTSVDEGTSGQTVWNKAKIGALGQLDPNTNNNYDSARVDIGLLDEHVYWVSPIGNDSNDGLDSTRAWATIDNGEALGILEPGDTVYVISGDYVSHPDITLSTSGLRSHPIVYRGFGYPRPIVSGLGDFTISGDHIVVDSLHILNSSSDGIFISGDSCEVRYCLIENANSEGIRITGSYHRVFRSIITRSSSIGLRCDNNSRFNHITNNTIFGSNGAGIRLVNLSSNSRLFNNIFVQNSSGIDGDLSNVCAFNDVWNNAGGSYSGGVTDSAGGISADPEFLDSGASDFRLLAGSPAIDAGLDLGYPYLGSAPDMGAEESDPDGFPPQIASIAPQSVTEGQHLDFTVTATDPDGPPPSIAAENLPPNATFIDQEDGTGDFAFDPDFTQQGGYAVRFIASDGILGDTAIALITVIDVNRPPVLTPIGPKSIDEGQSLVFGVSASDPDSTIAALFVENLPTNAAFVDSGTGVGSFWFNPDYTQAGLYNVRFIATDGDLADTELVTITVNNVNRAPNLIVPVAQTVDEGQILESVVSASDPDGGAPGLSASGLPVNATFVDSGNGVGLLTFNPSYTQAGLYDIEFVASDGDLADTGTVTITVNNVNLPPSIVPISDKVVGVGQHLAFRISSSDPDSTIPTLSAEDIPANTTFVDSGNGRGSFTFDPDAAQIGSYDIRFIATDGVLADTEMVRVTVISTNSAPVLDPIGPQSLLEGDTLVLVITASDADSAIPELLGEDLPIRSSLLDNGDGTADFAFLPDYTQAGVYLVRFIATDGSLADSELVTITVTDAGNQPPALAPIVPQFVRGGTVLEFAVTATDPDSTVPLLSAGLLPTNSSFVDSLNGTGGFTFSPTLAQLGEHVVRFVASDGTHADTNLVSVTVTAGPLASIRIVPDTVSVTADSGVTFTTICEDSLGNPTGCGSLTWGLTSPVGTIDLGGVFEATTVGTARAHVVCAFGIGDTNSLVQVTPGRLATLVVAPDSVDVLPLATRQFTANGTDADGNATSAGTLIWSTIGDIGTIDGSGLLAAGTGGIGRVVATSDIDGVTDSNRVVRVVSNGLARLVVSPDTASMLVNSTASFAAQGYTQDYQSASVGTLTWEVLGGIGVIDGFGNFVATNRGAGRIVATSSIAGISDTSSMIVVDVLTIDEVAIGDRFVNAGQTLVPLLAFTVNNRFAQPRTLTELIARHQHTGAGDATEVLSNLATTRLYRDKNGNRRLDAADSLMTDGSIAGESSTFEFAPFVVGPGESPTLYIAGTISDQPRDADSLDLYLVPASDLTTGDGSAVAGVDSLNSLGLAIVDGLTASQLSLVTTGVSEIGSEDGLVGILSLDVPRNGYEGDTLQVLSLRNTGTAAVTDFDSLVLFLDDGNGLWDGVSNEVAVKNLKHTGDFWSASGLSVPINSQMRRFHIAGAAAEFAQNGATISFGIPLHGIEMASGNDGPIDQATGGAGLVTIHSEQKVTAAKIDIPAATLIPGLNTAPLLGIQIVNGQQSSIHLQSLDCSLLAVDPAGASQAQLDSQIDSVMLWLDRDASPSVISSSDSLLAVTEVAGGVVSFESVSLDVPGQGGKTVLVLSAGMNLTNSKNANTIVFSVDDADAFGFVQAVTVSGEFPLVNSASAIIDAFPALAVGVHEIPRKSLYGGQTGQLVMDFTLPRNGYRNDDLRSISLVNVGTADETEALSSVALWSDAAPSGFGTDDALLGYFVPTDDGWILDGLRQLITSTANRFFIVVDIASDHFDGGTLQFQIPIDGIEYKSNMEGPDDHPIRNANEHLILPSNRITAISLPLETKSVMPGAKDHAVLAFALYNGYPNETKHLKTVTATNTTRTRSDGTFADSELGQLTLYVENDGDQQLDDDSLLAIGQFSDGMLRLSGFSLTLEPEDLFYFYIAAGVPLNAIDGDSLSVSIINYSDFEFSESVNINGDVPLSSGRYLVVDGSVKAQYGLIPINQPSLNPGESSVVLYAFRPASNGDVTDTLNQITFDNTGSADDNDITNTRAYIDIDEDMQPSAADVLLGVADYADGKWTVNGAALEITESPPAILFAGDVAENATPGASVRFALPIDGCQYTSSNDGPRDVPLVATNGFTISTSGLQIGPLSHGATFSVGQSFAIGVFVRNVFDNPITDVVPQIVSVSAPSVVQLDSLVGLGQTIAPDEVADYYYYFTGVSAESVTWSIMATSLIEGDTSATVDIGPVRIQESPEAVNIAFISSIPSSVLRAQKNVAPFSVQYSHPDSSQNSASLRLDGIALNVLNASGLPISASDAFDRIVVTTGNSIAVVLDVIPDNSNLILEFSSPVFINPQESNNLTVLLDISDEASVGSFMLSIQDASSLAPVDANTSAAVPVNVSGTFPLTTEKCLILEPSKQLAVSATDLLTPVVNLGQQNVHALELKLRHAGGIGSSQIQLRGLSCSVMDDAGQPVDPGDLFDDIIVEHNGFEIGSANLASQSGALLKIDFGAPLTLSPGEQQAVHLLTSIRNDAPNAGFAVSIPDSTLLTVRDISSGARIDAATDPLVLAQGSVFPITSTYATLRQPATTVDWCVESRLPSHIINGRDSVTLMDITFSYGGSVDHSPVEVREIYFTVHDSLDQLLDPNDLFDRLAYRVNGGALSYLSFFDTYQGAVRLTMDNQELSLGANETALVELFANFENDIAIDHFALSIWDAPLVTDGTDTTHVPGMKASPGCTAQFPFTTGVAQIIQPAGRPSLVAASLPTQVVAPGQSAVHAFAASLDYDVEGFRGDLIMHSIRCRVLQRMGDNLVPIDAQQVFSDVRLTINGSAVSTTPAFGADSISLVVDPGYVIYQGDVLELEIESDLAPDVALGNYVLQIDDAESFDIIDRQLATTAAPILSTGSFPLRGSELSVSKASLAESFTNFPNPFYPSDGQSTTIAFNLEQDARIDLEIFSVTGRIVRALVKDELRQAGSYSADQWDGLNAVERAVVPGTYFCRLTARFVSGERQEFQRKIAVIR